MSDDFEQKPAGDLGQEFRNLGKNLKEIFLGAMESEERRRIQKEIESGMAELGAVLNKTLVEFRESQTGQQLRSEMETLRERVRSGEMEDKSREELLALLRRINQELSQASSRFERQKPNSDSVSDDVI